MKSINQFRREIRQAVADYMNSEGCGCCSNGEAHHAHSVRLGKLLSVPKYPDGSGHDFPRFRERGKRAQVKYMLYNKKTA